MVDRFDPIHEAKAHGVRMAVLPISRLINLREDIKQFAANEQLNALQKRIVKQSYILNIPRLEYKVQSIVLAIWQLKLTKGTFIQDDKKVSCIMDNSFAITPMHEILTRLFETKGYHLDYQSWLPLKRMAVSAGLCEFGRNNVVYDKKWGSFILISGYFSDIPPKDMQWHEMKMMSICESCDKCLQNCPTHAILPERFLINNEKCLSNVNNTGCAEFPDWIPSSAHHRIIECFKCQEYCPVNQSTLQQKMESIEFTNTETSTILQGWNYDGYSPELKDKLKFYHSKENLDCIPRNINAMFNNSELWE